jgi:hypothetical protein
VNALIAKGVIVERATLIKTSHKSILSCSRHNTAADLPLLKLRTPDEKAPVGYITKGSPRKRGTGVSSLTVEYEMIFLKHLADGA